MRAALIAMLLLGAGPALAQGRPEPPAAERLVPGGRAGWVTTAKGCWLWAGGLERSSTDIAAEWSGACPNGPAEGTGRSVVRWRVGERQREMVWQGPLRNGKAEGRGTLVVTEDGQVQSRETGEYHEDRLVNGRLELPRQGIVYQGGWRLGHPDGPGELRAEGQVFRGNWENGCLLDKGRWIAFTRQPDQCQGQAT